MDYKPVGRLVTTPDTTQWLFECQSCGAAVSNTEVHDKFHESLSRAADQASSADAWTRPMGGRAGSTQKIKDPYRRDFQVSIPR
jgi:hypothetical protein